MVTLEIRLLVRLKTAMASSGKLSVQAPLLTVLNLC